MGERYIKVDSFLNGLFGLSNEISKGLEAIEKSLELNDTTYPSPVSQDHLFEAYHSLEKAQGEVEHEIARLVGNNLVQSGKFNHQ